MDNINPPCIPFAFPGLPQVKCLFSTATSNNMSLWADRENPERVLKNRIRFMSAAGFSQWAEVQQVHGDRLVKVEFGTGLSAEDVEKADGLYTSNRQVGLIIKSADCQPILIARQDGKAIAALHVGWRGNSVNFPITAVQRLANLFSCAPGDMMAVRGPSLGPAASEFVNFHNEWPSEFAPWFDEKKRTVNLWLLTRHQLMEAGLKPECIFSLDLCTYDTPGLLFSHRRRDAGRQVSVIWLD